MKFLTSTLDGPLVLWGIIFIVIAGLIKVFKPNKLTGPATERLMNQAMWFTFIIGLVIIILSFINKPQNINVYENKKEIIKSRQISDWVDTDWKTISLEEDIFGNNGAFEDITNQFHSKYYLSEKNKIVCSLIYLPSFHWINNKETLSIKNEKALLDSFSDVRMQNIYNSALDIISIGSYFYSEKETKTNLAQSRAEYLLNILQRKNFNTKTRHHSLTINYKNIYPNRKNLSFIVILKRNKTKLTKNQIKKCFDGVKFDQKNIKEMKLLDYDSVS